MFVLLIAIFPFSTGNSSNLKLLLLTMTCSKSWKQLFELYNFLFYSVALWRLRQKPWVVVNLYWMSWIDQYIALFHLNKHCHDNFSSITKIFSYIFEISSFFIAFCEFVIYPCDVTNSCITNLHTNLVYLGLVKIIVAQDGTGSFFEDAN